MADYKGSKCISCGERFAEDDDIVVCPDCGTPYHRSCYEKEGKCINYELHKSGGSWKSDVSPTEKGKTAPDGKHVCPVCGLENPAGTPFCQRCGQALAVVSQVKDESYSRPGMTPEETAGSAGGMSPEEFAAFLINYSDPLCGFDPNEPYGETRVCEMADYIGKNTHYYLPLFKRFKLTGGKFSMNLSALIAPELYFANRKMIFASILCIIIRLFLNIPRFILIGANPQYNFGFITEIASHFDVQSTAFQVLIIMFSILTYAFMVGTSCFANWLYYRKVLKTVPKIRKKTHPYELRATLAAKGGTSPLALSMVIVFYVFALIGLEFYIGTLNI